MNSYSTIVKDNGAWGNDIWTFKCKARNIGEARKKVWDYDFNLIILGTVKTNKRGDYYDD